MDKKLQSKEVDLDKMFTPDMAKAADMLAYAFLKEKGYDTNRCMQHDRKGAAARTRLKKALEKDGLYLEWHLPTKENKIFCFYTLRRISDNEKIATSRSIEFVCDVINIGGAGESE